MKKSFLLYQDYEQHIALLTDEQAGKLLKAIFKFNAGSVPDLDPVVHMAFSFIKSNLERDNEKYASMVERNKNNGLKGGRPKIPETQNNPNNPVGFLGTQNNPEEPKKADTDTDTDTGNENEKEKKKYPSIVPQGEKLLIPAPVIEKPPKAKKPRAMQMPQGWKPHDAHRAKCSSLGLNPTTLAEEFENHHVSKGNMFVDWDRAFFTWIGNAKKFNSNNRGIGHEGFKPNNSRNYTEIDGSTGEVRTVTEPASGAPRKSSSGNDYDRKVTSAASQALDYIERYLR